VRPPVRPVKGEVVRLRAGAGERPCERIVAAERVYVVPRAGDEVVVGATVEDRGFDLRVTAGGVLELLREAYRALPEIAELELVECTAGLRPATPDNAPVVGRTAIEGLVLAGGHHRNGILLAPLTADAVVAAVAGEEMPESVRSLGPERFADVGAAR
jgi:glycine oxidase